MDYDYNTLQRKLNNLKNDTKLKIQFSKKVIEKINDLEDFAAKHKDCTNDIEKITFVSKFVEKFLRTTVISDEGYHDCYMPEIAGKEDEIVQLMSDGKFVTKTITTNIIMKQNICTFRDENPYFCTYQDFYFPLKIEIYCEKDFDDTKLYTIDEINKLVKDNKIIHFKNRIYDEKIRSEKLPNKNNNYTICGINYGKNYIKKQAEEYRNDNINKDIHFEYDMYWLYEIGSKGYHFARENIIDNFSVYPNLSDVLTKFVLNTLQTDKKSYLEQIEQAAQKFTEDYYKILENDQNNINNYQKILDKEKAKLKKLQQKQDDEILNKL